MNFNTIRMGFYTATTAPSLALAVGETLPAVTRLKSPQRAAYAVLQSDGNFVLYKTDTNEPLWATGTNGKQVSGVKLQADGNLVLLDRNGNAVWATATQGSGAKKLVVQDDGNMVLLNGNNVPVWASDTWGFKAHKNEGLFDYIGDGVSDIVDVVTSIPGVNFVAEQVQDFARTDVGKTFFRGVSSYLVPIMFTVNPGLGIIASSAIGGALGATAFVMPGLLRGEAVDQAFLNEAKSAAQKFGAQFKDDLPEATKALQDWGDANGVDFDKLANEGIDARNLIAKGIDAKTLGAIAHVPPEVAQLAIDAATRTQNAAGHIFDGDGNVANVDVNWHPTTWTGSPAPATAGVASRGAQESLQDFLNRMSAGTPAATPPKGPAMAPTGSQDGASGGFKLPEPPPAPKPPTKTTGTSLPAIGFIGLGIGLLLLLGKK